MGKCKECKYYNSALGYCDKLNELGLNKEADDGVYQLYDGQEYCIADLIVGADFGCIHFERREE